MRYHPLAAAVKKEEKDEEEKEEDEGAGWIRFGGGLSDALFCSFANRSRSARSPLRKCGCGKRKCPSMTTVMRARHMDSHVSARSFEKSPCQPQLQYVTHNLALELEKIFRFISENRKRLLVFDARNSWRCTRFATMAPAGAKGGREDNCPRGFSSFVGCAIGASVELAIAIAML